MRKSPVIIVVIMLILSCSNTVFGFDPMGPPKAMLSKEEPGGRLEYLYGNMDIRAEDPGGSNWIDIEDMEINKIYANIGYGFADGWEIFARLGAAAVSVDESANMDNYGSLIGSSNFNFAIGGGARVTFFESKDISVGLLAQISHTGIDDFNSSSDLLPGLAFKLSMTEIQVAVGPTWNCTEWLSIYGGPFLHFIDGDISLNTTITGWPADIEQDEILGGYIGANLRFSESPNINCNIEFQTTGAGYAVAIQLAISP